MSTTVCEICSNMGGAYKALDKPGKWIHSLCSSWIPEIYSVDFKNDAKLTINKLDKKRFRLKCVLCTGKGACIQCSYGKCCTPAHPWCVLHTPKGFTRRVIRDEDDEVVWDIFCKAHASAVSEPLKPKNKSKILTLPTGPLLPAAASIQEGSEERDRERDRGYRGNRKGNNRRETKPQYSMAHSVRKMLIHPTQSDESVKQYRNSNLIKKDGLGQNKKEKRVKDSEEEETEEEDEEEDDEVGRKNSTLGSKELKNRTRFKSQKDLILKTGKGKENGHGRGNGNKNENESQTQIVPSAQSALNHSSFPILTLNEWPGQSEGEAMDLDHFWNVAAMQYPEDHPAAVRGLLLLLFIIYFILLLTSIFYLSSFLLFCIVHSVFYILIRQYGNYFSYLVLPIPRIFFLSFPPLLSLPLP